MGFLKLSSANNSEAQEKVDALNRSQAVIEFSLEGVIQSANENFLSALDYRLEDIKGKHHSMFVEPSFRDSVEYRQFWEKLKRGEFQAAQYKRIGKNGKEVWIEATYNPIIGKDGRPYKVVKFATDVTKTKSEYADLRGQVDAIRKAQAVIEFSLDGTIIDANDNFLNTLGYRLDEIKGKHHSIFVEPSYRDSGEYRQFWEELKRGAFQAAQYKRIGKNGKEVWIEASYNPIFDLNGKPYKVVKYATDITSQMNLLSDLKKMIDSNFGEIEGALDSVEGQSSSAQKSALSTQSNVQTVAAAAEELAASAKEISDSMLRSRQASESAYQEAESADQAAQRLADVARAMGGIVDLIRSIAGQINLLALNATIEAARAGDAGKGFAVVANEVKNLANQSANATAQISKEIEGMQAVSGDVVGSLAAIRKAMDSVREFVTVTAGAVEEQSAVTRDMSTNMQNASASVESVTHGVADISVAVQQVRQAVFRTKEAAEVLAR